MTAKPNHDNKEESLVKTSLGEVVKALWPSLKPYRWRFGLGLLFIAVSTGIELYIPLVVGRVVDAVSGTLGSDVKDLCYLFLALVLVKAVVDSVQAFVIQSTGQYVTHDLRSLLFRHISKLSVSYFDRNPAGRLLTRVVNDIKSLSELFTASMSVLVLDLAVIFGTVFAMFALNWKLAAATLAAFPLVFVTIVYFGNQLARAYRKVRARLAEMNSFLGENIGAVATIQRLSAEEEREKKFEAISESHYRAQMESVQVFSYVQPIANVLNGIATATLLILGGLWAIEGHITLGVVVAFLGYLRNIFQPIRDLVEKYNTFLSSMVSAERVIGILKERPEPAGGFRNELGTMRDAEITFSDVTFCYPSRQTPAIENISFKLPARKSLAIVGATGSGKSTLIRLLLRFYDPTAGEIVFGGRRLDEWDRRFVRSAIGTVQQESYLFPGTIRENLLLGRSGIEDGSLIDKCKRAQLWDFIRNRGGLDMQVLEGGANLSLGERQLLAIARVLVMDAPVIIFDEATSNVDRIVERKLGDALRELLAGRTAIVIAHRLSTIRECDSVIVLEQGKLEEEGTYEALLKKDGRLAAFHEIQLLG